MLIAIALSAAVQAGAPRDVEHRWLARPTGQQLADAYPEKALRAYTSGDVVMHCKVASDGRLIDCAITGETPKGWGFGAAVLKLAPLYKVSLLTPDGTPTTEGEVDIPVGFNVPKPK